MWRLISPLFPLLITLMKKAEFNRLDKLAHNAVRSLRKYYSFSGSLTEGDLKNYAWLGILSALKQPKYISHPNKDAYLFAFATGYCRHALHRKSRLVKVPYEVLKTGQAGLSHFSYSWDNLPEPGTAEISDRLNPNAEAIASTFSKSDQTKILIGDFDSLSKSGKQLVEIVKNQYNMETIYE